MPEWRLLNKTSKSWTKKTWHSLLIFILKSITKFMCCIYWSPNVNSCSRLFDTLSTTFTLILNILMPMLSFSVMFITRTDWQGRAARSFLISNNLANFLITIPFLSKSFVKNWIYPCLISHSEPHQYSITCCLGLSHHGLIFLEFSTLHHLTLWLCHLEWYLWVLSCLFVG